MGTGFVYAGQYQPEAAGRLREIESPAFVAVGGKPRTYETDDGTVNVSLRQKHLTIVDKTPRHRWVRQTVWRPARRYIRVTGVHQPLCHEEKTARRGCVV